MTLIKPVLLYGCETWATAKNDENKMGTFKREVLRRIYEPINDNGNWRTRHNQELYQLFSDPDIIK